MILKHREADGLYCSAGFSECERYRYGLQWRWDALLPPLVAFMLNPSTATHEVLDRTVTGCMLRAKEQGFGAVWVINIFAYRATDPKDMKAAADPVGPENDRAILAVLDQAVMRSGKVIAGWGAHGNHRGRASEILQMVEHRSVLDELWAFDINQNGTPKHPLYVPRALEPKILWRRG